MIRSKTIENGIVEVKSTMRIDHHRADLITVHVGHNAYCNFPSTVELALSNGYDFLVESVPEFREWAVLIDDSEEMRYYNMRSETHSGLVMTYRNVPIAALAKFLNIYQERY
jgi:hypothetical protein